MINEEYQKYSEENEHLYQNRITLETLNTINKIKIVSFSGGKDSTAMLLKLINEEIIFDEVLYVEDFFPYPKYIMDYYFKYVERQFKVKITHLPLNYKEEVMKNKIYPSGGIKYCTRLKAEIQWRYLKKKYGRDNLLFLLGTRKDESEKRSAYSQSGDWYWNKRFHVNYNYFYPIFEFTEDKVFSYLKENHIELNPLYPILETNRLGCSLCMNTPKTQIQKYFKLFPDDFKEFVQFEDKMEKLYPKKNIKMFPKKSIKQLQNDFTVQKDLNDFTVQKDLNISSNPYLFPVIKKEMGKLSTKEIVNLFFSIIKIEMSENFYSLPEKERIKKLNKLFPKFINKLSITNQQNLYYIASLLINNWRIRTIKSLRNNILSEKENIRIINELKEKAINEHKLANDYFEKEYLEQEKLLSAAVKKLRNNGFFKKRGINE